MTNSDGIYVRGELVEAGDWTGFGGAERILSEHGLDVAVLETARGGILLRGIGYSSNDVSVVTNVSADHLGLQGIDTVDELADVKSTVVRITKRDGWAVLNADDPRAWAMRRLTRARIYAFSLEGRTDEVRQRAPARWSGGDAGGRLDRAPRGDEAAAPPARGRRSAGHVRRAVRSQHRERAGRGGRLRRPGPDDAPDQAGPAEVRGSTTPPTRAGSTSSSAMACSPWSTSRTTRQAWPGCSTLRGPSPGAKVRLAYGTAGDRTDEILHRLGRPGRGRRRSRHLREAPLPARPGARADERDPAGRRTRGRLHRARFRPTRPSWRRSRR